MMIIIVIGISPKSQLNLKEEEGGEGGAQVIGWTAVWIALARTWLQVPSGQQRSEGAPQKRRLLPQTKKEGAAKNLRMSSEAE